MGNIPSGIQFDEEFDPRVELHILVSDDRLISPSFCHLKTEMAHMSLRTYFYPHQSAATVAWTHRENVRKSLLTKAMETHKTCPHKIVAAADNLQKVLKNSDAVLFLSKDAEKFVQAHGVGFLDTLAVTLTTTPNRILLFDMSLKQGEL